MVIDENATLGEIPFKLFKIWYKKELLKTVKSEIEIYIISLKKEIKECVSEVEKVRDENTTLKNVVAQQQRYLETLKQNSNQKTFLYQVYQKL